MFLPQLRAVISTLNGKREAQVVIVVLKKQQQFPAWAIEFVITSGVAWFPAASASALG